MNKQATKEQGMRKSLKIPYSLNWPRVSKLNSAHSLCSCRGLSVLIWTFSIRITSINIILIVWLGSRIILHRSRSKVLMVRLITSNLILQMKVKLIKIMDRSTTLWMKLLESLNWIRKRRKRWRIMAKRVQVATYWRCRKGIMMLNLQKRRLHQDLKDPIQIDFNPRLKVHFNKLEMRWRALNTT